MKKNQVSIIFISEDVNEEKLLQNLRKSDYKIFAIRILGAYTEKVQKLCTSFCTLLRNRECQVFLEIRSVDDLNLCQTKPSVVYITKETDLTDISEIVKICLLNKIKIVYRIVPGELTSEETLAAFSLYEDLYSQYPFTYLFIRTDFCNLDDLIVLCNENLKNKKNVYLLDAPLCSKDFTDIKITSSALLDLSEQITEDQEPKPYDKKRYLSEFKKLKNPCISCPSIHNCFGLKKTASFQKLKSGNFSYDKSLADILNAPSVDILTFNPKNKTKFEADILTSLNTRRILKNFEGDNFYYIWDFQNSFYFNRPLEPCQMWQEDPRGLPSINWQFIGSDIPELQWKSKCGLLVPKNGVVTTVKIKFDENWSIEKQEALDRFTFQTIKDIILKHGGQRDFLEQKGNDLLYKNKKFAGKEWKFVKNLGYIENIVLTCKYLEEKSWFDKLYHWDGEKQITGITDELPEITKELIIQELYQKALEFFCE